VHFTASLARNSIQRVMCLDCRSHPLTSDTVVVNAWTVRLSWSQVKLAQLLSYGLRFVCLFVQAAATESSPYLVIYLIIQDICNKNSSIFRHMVAALYRFMHTHVSKVKLSVDKPNRLPNIRST